jgi:hypothetical protein
MNSRLEAVPACPTNVGLAMPLVTTGMSWIAASDVSDVEERPTSATANATVA